MTKSNPQRKTRAENANLPGRRSVSPQHITPRKSVPQKRPKTQSASFPPKDSSTSWGKVAKWYDKHLSGDNTYHQKVLLPNLLRLVEPESEDTILDLACGQGFFSRAFAENGAGVIGIDIGEELIAIAKKESPNISYITGSIENLNEIASNSIDKSVIVLAIQNTEHADQVIKETARVLKEGGVFHIVMNHPAFRIPKKTSWDYDQKKQIQYRRIDQYLSEGRSQIDMHPGIKDSPQTVSFHRPLQYYFKHLGKSGFAVDRLEEWISHRESDSGERSKAENSARKEIPLFLYLRAIKYA